MAESNQHVQYPTCTTYLSAVGIKPSKKIACTQDDNNASQHSIVQLYIVCMCTKDAAGIRTNFQGQELFDMKSFEQQLRV